MTASEHSFSLTSPIWKRELEVPLLKTIAWLFFAGSDLAVPVPSLFFRCRCHSIGPLQAEPLGTDIGADVISFFSVTLVFGFDFLIEASADEEPRKKKIRISM